MVGARLPTLLVSPVVVSGRPADSRTDGSPGIRNGLDLSRQPKILADQILARHSRNSDDATRPWSRASEGEVMGHEDRADMKTRYATALRSLSRRPRAMTRA